MMNWIKGKVMSKARDYINDKFMAGIGTIQDLKIDTDKKSVSATVKLLGDKESVEVVIKKYAIKDDKIIIKEITVDKKWMNTVANSFLVGKKFDLPPGVSIVL